VTKVTPQRKQKFLDALADTANVTAAAKASKVTRKTWYEHRTKDAAFAEAWDAALELGIDSLEDEAVRRGRDGYLKPVYQGGRRVGTVREYSDTLLIFMLKSRRPDKFKERSAHEITGKDGKPIAVASPLDEIYSRIARLAARAGAAE
jgi:hypothetical protein